MDVREVKLKQARLRVGIEEMLKAFYKETGVVPDVTVYWDTVHRIGVVPEKKPIVNVNLTL